jgi:hypothetical protein
MLTNRTRATVLSEYASLHETRKRRPFGALCSVLVFAGASTLLGCAGEEVYLTSPDRVELRGDMAAREALRRTLQCEEDALRGGSNEALMWRISALEAVHERTLARLQMIDDKLEAERWRARGAAMADGRPAFEEFLRDSSASASNAARKPECTPAFFMDQDGIKKPKPECL